jgi:hypothetical protein
MTFGRVTVLRVYLRSQSKPGIVFCHGLWADGSRFRKRGILGSGIFVTHNAAISLPPFLFPVGKKSKS